MGWWKRSAYSTLRPDNPDGIFIEVNEIYNRKPSGLSLRFNKYGKLKYKGYYDHGNEVSRDVFLKIL